MEKVNKQGLMREGGREGGRWKDENVGQVENREWLRV